MTNIITLLLAIISAFGLYSQTYVVINVDEQADVVQMVDGNGELWEFEGIEDWREGDFCSCIMYDNHTPIIYDDVILTTRYSGYADLFPDFDP